MTISPEQCRMARAALRMTVRDVAERAGVSSAMISRLENDQIAKSEESLDRIRSAFEARGIVFLNNDLLGVGLLKPQG